MDIFSGIRSIQNNTYDKVDIKHNNITEAHNRKTEEIQKDKDDLLKNKSKDEIRAELQKVIQELNEAMNPLNRDLEFKFNEKVDELIVQVVDKKKNIVIREFPPKEALKLMEKMRELVGMLFDKKG